MKNRKSLNSVGERSISRPAASDDVGFLVEDEVGASERLRLDQLARAPEHNLHPRATSSSTLKGLAR